MSSDRFSDYVAASSQAAARLVADHADVVVTAGGAIRDALRAGHKLLVCGNGGSAADAQHLCAEVVCRFETERRAYPAIALSANVSSLTAWSNDYDFDTVFARQVQAFGGAGDVLVAISTSGNSSNVVEAVKAARSRGVVTIGLLGRDGGALAALVDIAVVVPATRTAHIQECHLMIYHFWCELLDS